MKKFFSGFAVPFVFSALMIFALTSCSKAETLYAKGNYQGAINKIDHKMNPTPEDYLLKARSYIEMGKGQQALESLVLYLSFTESTGSDRSFAISKFIEYNTSDRLSVLLLSPDDGVEAQKVLYKAYVRQGNLDQAKTFLEILSSSLPRTGLMDLMFDNPVDAQYMLGELVEWFSDIEETEKDSFLGYVVRLSGISMSEVEAKQFLSLTDVLMEDSHFLSDDRLLSSLLKTKGNILEKLYDKVNARIYWTQAYRLNPEDEELAMRIK